MEIFSQGWKFFVDNGLSRYDSKKKLKRTDHTILRNAVSFLTI